MSTPEEHGAIAAGSIRITGHIEPHHLIITDATHHSIGGIRADGTVYLHVGIDEIIEIAPTLPLGPEPIITIARLAYQAGLDAATAKGTALADAEPEPALGVYVVCNRLLDPETNEHCEYDGHPPIDEAGYWTCPGCHRRARVTDAERAEALNHEKGRQS